MRTGARRSRRRARQLALIALGMIAVAGCASGTPKARAPVPGMSVVIHLVSFNPQGLQVGSGSAVTWTQQDAGFHTVTSGIASTDATGAVATHPDGTFDSGKLSTGKTFSFTFSTPGVYRYFCQIHPATMRGVVTVK